MATINPEEELLSSIASLSPPLSLKSGTLDVPLANDLLPSNSNNTPEPTVPTTNNSTISQSNKPSSNNLKSRHSPTPPPNNLHFTIDNHPIPPKRNIISSKILFLLILVFYLQLFNH